MQKKTETELVLFDLDGTLTKKDTLIEVIRFIHGEYRLYIGAIVLSPFLILYIFRIISSSKMKEKVITHFFGGMSIDAFQQKCNRFAEIRLPTLLRRNAISHLNKAKENGAKIIIVSASVENWISHWCESNDLVCIATRLEIKNGRLTGKLVGKNCNGTEKVTRIKQAVNLSDYKTILGYGNSKGDLPMLKLATQVYYKAFQ